MNVSKLFNFSSILTESTYNLVKEVREPQCLSEALSIMKEFDRSVQENTRILYDSILEAESKKDENACFGKYYIEYKNSICKFTSQMRELASKFHINLETIIDANNGIVDKVICGDHPAYKGAQFANLLSDEVPNINPYKAFKKEWGLLGRLFQDLDPAASDEEKAKIITLVYNSLSKDINDGWLDKCIKKISDSDDCNKDNFAKIMYDKFVTGGEVDINIDIPTVEQSKLAIKNYTNYTDCILKSVNDYCDGLNKVAEEIGSMLFRNMDKKLDIKTDEEGVADATYRLNDYTMNQINIFLNTKVSQIRELTNLYIIALSIKMDCIYKYIKQCIAIIEYASSPCSDNNTEDQEGGEETPDTMLDDEGEEAPELPEGKSTSSFDDSEDLPVENPDEEPEDIEHNTPVVDDSKGEEQLDDETGEVEEEPPVEESSISDFDRDLYLAEANITLLNRFCDYIDLQREYIKEEDETTTQSTDSQTSEEPVESAEEAAAKRGKSLIQKINDLRNSAKDSRNGTYASQIKFIKENKDKILKAPIPSKWTIQNYDLSSFKNMPVIPLNFNDRELYKNKDEFLKAKYTKYGVPSDKKGSVIDFFLRKVYSDKEVKYTDKERMLGFNYIVKDYDVLYSHLFAMGKTLSDTYNKEYEIMQKAKGVKKPTKESATFDEYFTEDFTGIDEAGGDMDWKERWKIVNDWFNVQMPVIVAYTNIITRNFKKQYAFLKKLESIKTK